MNKYTISWRQDYPGWEGIHLIRQLEAVKAELLERLLEHPNYEFPEANQVINKIKQQINDQRTS
jgi:hypothetical protein